MAIRLWTPSPIWSGRSCYLVGGGHSLKTFDWQRLRGHCVLGCNAAFYLGADLVPWTIFGDGAFITRHGEGLERYVEAGGQVVTHSGRFRKRGAPLWLKMMTKQTRGMGLDRLGWNGNTGASAINLALLFGADPVYLLGYDMRTSESGEANFHNAYNAKATAKTYCRFLKRMGTVAHDLAQLFPGRHVINLEDDTSSLDVFPKESLAGHTFSALVGA